MTRAPLWLAVFLVVTPACEDSTPVERGFASRQVTQLRDRLPGARAQSLVAGRPVGRDHQPERHPLTG